MDSNTIEMLAVNHVKEQISKSLILSPWISEKDKEPSWDGNIYIYKSSNKSKENLDGRIPVQVKGKVCSDFSKPKINYSAQVSDLKNYLFDGGVIYFVVYIKEESLERKLYYCALPPIKLRSILSGIGEQKKKSIVLDEFPADINEGTSIILNCFRHCQMQANISDRKLRTLEELEKEGVLEGLTIPLYGIGKMDIQKALFQNEPYIYAKIKGTTIPQSLDIIPHKMMTEAVITENVSINGRVFYSNYKVIRSKDSYTIKIGHSFTLKYVYENHNWEVNFKMPSTVRQKTTDIDFFLSLLAAEGFEINAKRLPFNLSYKDFNIDKNKINDYEQILERVRQCSEVLDVLHCQDDLDLSALNESDLRKMWALVEALVKKVPVKGMQNTSQEYVRYVIGPLAFILIIRNLDEESSMIYDFFDVPLCFSYEDENGEHIPTSRFDVFNADDYLSIKNIRFDLLLSSYQELDCKQKYDYANDTLLKLISAYDKSDDTKAIILDTALDLAKWIKDSPETGINNNVVTLNYLQVIKRKRALTSDEANMLWDIVSSNEASDECKLGAYLLLDQMVPAKRILDNLTGEEQEIFKSYPIFRFYRES